MPEACDHEGANLRMATPDAARVSYATEAELVIAVAGYKERYYSRSGISPAGACERKFGLVGRMEALAFLMLVTR